MYDFKKLECYRGKVVYNTYTVKLRTDNQGGWWPLKDNHWKDLAESGWTVEWASERKQYLNLDGIRFCGQLADCATIEVFALSPNLAEESVVR